MFFKLREKNNLLDNLKLITFDFDCTITNITSSPYINVENLLKSEDKKAFYNLIKDLIKKEKYLGIASYGYKEVILKTMEKVFTTQNPFNEQNVLTPLDIAIKYGITWPEGGGHQVLLIKTIC